MPIGLKPVEVLTELTHEYRPKPIVCQVDCCVGGQRAPNAGFQGKLLTTFR